MGLYKIFLLISLNFISFNENNDINLAFYKNNNYNFNEGLYLIFEDVLQNQPVPASNIITDLDKNSTNFYQELFKQENLTILQPNGNQITIKTAEIWGFSKKDKLYINWNNSPTMIPIVGSISHFVGVQRIEDYSYHQSVFGYGYSPTPTIREEMIQCIIDFSDGQVYPFNVKNIDPIFARDKELYAEWLDLSKRKRKKFIFVYLQKFNERNPLKIKPKISIQ